MIALGIFLHSVGGFAAGSFYIPFKKVRNWAWESYWLVNGFMSWIIMPWIIAFVTVPGLLTILRESPKSSILWSYLFGLLWGIGGLTFGLSMRYLGMSLGYAIALGFCAAFGTIIPPIYEGTFDDLITSTSGLTMLAGVAVCLLGIAVCGWAGISKEKELPDEVPEKTVSIGADTVWLPKLVADLGMAKSNSAARRLIQGGGVRQDGEKVGSVDTELAPGSYLLQVGKRQICKVTLKK